MATSVDVLCKEYEKAEVPEFGAGDTVRVHVRVVEGNRERIQVFDGVVIRYRGGGSGDQLHGAPDCFARHRRRAHLSAALTPGRAHRSSTKGQGPPRPVVLPAGADRTGRAHQGAPASRPAAARRGRITLTRQAPPFPRWQLLPAARPSARKRACSWGWRVRGPLALG